MKSVIPIITILFLFVNCQSDKKEDLVSDIMPLTIKVPSISDSTFTSIDHLLKMDSYTILSSDLVLGEIKRVIIHEDNLYVLDTHDKIVCFGEDGSVKFQIDAKGRGPGEYVKAKDFSMDFKNNRLKVYDNFTKRLIHYSSVNGQFLSEEKMDIVPDVIASTSESNYFFNPYNYNYPDSKTYHFSLLWSKSNTDIDKKYLPHRPVLAEYLVGFGRGHPFSYNSFGIYFTNRFDKIVYNLKDDTLSSKYNIELPNEPPLSHLEQKPYFGKLLKSEYSVGLSDIYECGNILYFNFNNGGHVISTFYDISRQELIYCGKSVFPSPTKELPVYYPISGVYKDQFFSLVSSSMIEILKKDNHDVFPSDWLKVKSNDNPVLVFYKLK